MFNDIQIQHIVDVFHDEHNRKWKRDSFKPRIWDGITLLTEGCTEYRFADKTLVAHAGDLVFLPGRLPYTGVKQTEYTSYYVINFECASPDEFERFGAPMTVTAEDFDAVRREIADGFEAWNRQPVNAVLQLKSVLYHWLSLAPQNREPDRGVSDTDRIVDYILRNLADPNLSVTRLCKEFYISESQLRRNLLKATSLKPNDYILTLRLRKAESELLNTQKPIKRIAEECGFASPYYFSRCFSEHLQLSPREYRRRFGAV